MIQICQFSGTLSYVMQVFPGTRRMSILLQILLQIRGHLKIQDLSEKRAVIHIILHYTVHNASVDCPQVWR